ncbi:MAG TPA: penicillin-binding transpeptidase domain-containing protein, partial [Thermoleophilaceae bacterium]|nr:penicillin-binding transpeptidase domain-containing protein [Thermoleophilaceae bacterium]
LQRRAQEAIDTNLPDGGPSASLVAIDNKTGGVKAMVGGENFTRQPFNVATNGHRQPGSAFKPFTLITALQQGVSPDRTYASRKKVLRTREGPFEVNNYQDEYAGVTSLRDATAKSDNSVYAELGLDVGTKNIARTARAMGIRTPLSTNGAMTLGGLEQGVTPLEMAYAYSTIANRGERHSGTMASSEMGPVAIESVKGGDTRDRNKRIEKRVFSRETGEQAHDMLRLVVTSGTGKAADPGEGKFVAGKTGTTENYGDAWFVGFDDRYTIAVWVGYPDKVRYMKTEYRGQPVAGGTYPAEIWKDFVLGAGRLEDERNPDRSEPAGPAPGVATPGAAAGGGAGAGAGAAGAGAGAGYGGSASEPAPTPPAPSQAPSSPTPGSDQTPQSGAPSSSGTGTPSGY